MLLSAFTGPVILFAQERETNYDEAKVPEYTLPDPLVSLDGTKVTDEAGWTEQRRPEILKLFREQVYGIAPARTGEAGCRTVESGEAYQGTAERRQVEITLRRDGKELVIGVLLYIPKNRRGPVPAFLGLNFRGNHTVGTDPEIILNANWMRPRGNGDADNRATEDSRGTSSSRWEIETVLKRGYALATAYYGDIDPDYDDGFNNGVHALFSEQERPADAWGSIGAWAWGLSRILDFLETDGAVDGERVVVLGHSRLGKTSLWAGARDERFAMVISNNSGCGGAALSRRAFGETVEVINTSFPHWFCDNFKQYNGREAQLPVDQHMLLALIAPRPVYVASAEEDRWADPRGEFLALKHAAPVYRLLTGEGIAVQRMPAVNQPVTGRLGYHIRSGRHDVTGYDWDRYLDWADAYLPVR
ncbi:MAG: acetylxylan esterase [Candidatus Glassbacteria bacterium]|nr:acetylxylan esterase [Candidatus Glassbacteria bacterium]